MDTSSAPTTDDLTPEPATDVGLRPPRYRVDPRCRLWWTAQVGVVGVPSVGLLLVLGLLISPARTWLLLAAAVLFVATLVGLVAVPRIRWAIHRWEATDDAVYSRSGLFWEEWRAAPLSRVQTVDKPRGPLQRLFGLATVVVTSASAKGSVRVSALDSQLAEEMVDRLTLLAEDDQRDAT